MAQVKQGDTVKVHYTGTFEDGTQFDTSKDKEPLEFTMGSGEIIPGFEEALMGMEEGATKNVTLPPEKAYGPRRDDLVMTVDRAQVPGDITPEVGLQLGLSNEQGQTIPVTITEVTDQTITLDANSPMAGKTLNFELELISIG